MNNESFARCLTPLLIALKWQGSTRHLKESMPHFTNIDSLTSLREILNNLHFSSLELHVDGTEIDNRLLPALAISVNEEAYVILECQQNQFKVFSGKLNKEILIDEIEFLKLFQNRSLFVFKSKKEEELSKTQSGWFWITVRQNKGLFYSALFLSFILSFLMLSTSVFVMAVYDYVINSASYLMLIEFCVGIIIALTGIFYLYKIRAQHLSLLGTKFNTAIGNQIMFQLLFLAPIYTETTTVGSQIDRIKDFDRLREFISGPMLNVFFDLPFLVIGLVIVAMLAGFLVLIPLAALALFSLSSYFMSIKINAVLKNSSKHFLAMHEFLLEAIESVKVIKYSNRIDVWNQRYRELSAETNLATVKLTLYDFINNTICEFILMGTGLLILSIGAVQAMDNKLSVGILLGIMMIVWRILGPIRAVITTLPRLLQLNVSVKQIERLMALPSESNQISQIKRGKVDFQGDIDFVRVSMRYPTAYNPSLLGVSCTIKKGDFIVITGRNGSGKSTFLKIILGLYNPQAGAILIDGRDIRQLNPLDLRSGIGYLPQTPELFYGTIESNLRLGDPGASQEDLIEATKKAGILESILALPAQFKTKIYDQNTQNLSTSFSQAICLARTYLRDSTILLLDEPGNALDKNMDDKLIEYLISLKGKKTVVIVSHRPSHWQKADQVFLMDKGQMVLQGAPLEVIQKIPPALL